MRLTHHIHHTFAALGLAAAPFLVGCSVYDVPEGWVVVKPQEEFVLNITVGGDVQPASRAPHRIQPEGDEDGDGRELGQSKENDIENLVVFYCNGGIGASSTAPVKKLLYKDDVNFHPDTSADPRDKEYLQLRLGFSSRTLGYEYTAGDRFIVVANMGNISAMTLGDLRDKLVDHAWNVPASATCKADYDHFVMSNERESVFTPGTGAPGNPHKINVTIERVAARLDFCIDGAQVPVAPTTVPSTSAAEPSKPALIYPVEDKMQRVGTIYLTHVRPFNVMQQPTYLIKRCATPADKTTLSYLANENAYTGGDYQNFPIVLEPNTWSKPIDGSHPNFAPWFGASYLPNVSADSWFTDQYRVHNTMANDGFSANGISNNGDSYCKNYYVLDYANENTMQAAASASNTVTGIYLRAIYVPSKVFSSAADAIADNPATYTMGTTFYRYRPMVTEYDETQSVYFDNAGAANDYKAAHPEVPAVVEWYTNGICYYPVYYRHDNGDDVSPAVPDATPMEYGIVRNNIYRMKVSFTGPGYKEIPTVPEEPLGIEPYIFARKWYLIEHPAIDI